MPLPLAPIAGFALRYGAVAVAAYAVSRHVDRGFRDQRAEDALDDLNEGLSLNRDGDQANVSGRYRRIIRIGDNGPGIEVDISGFGRVKLRRVSPG